MPQYNFVICNSRGRAKYPRSFDLPDIEAARHAALKIARVFTEVVPFWRGLPPEQKSDFVVEIVDEAGETTLTVPFRDVDELKP
ncbi:DUF6894 family protein [Microvirga pakistanensis]|uniref:DUF6894 family protein n=1 Tax=Microvirga pakistanensis TaxID=1682650 RepID=UPI00106A4963|nr:hypothetical protein [Microvirga pakistanensis]